MNDRIPDKSHMSSVKRGIRNGRETTGMRGQARGVLGTRRTKIQKPKARESPRGGPSYLPTRGPLFEVEMGSTMLRREVAQERYLRKIPSLANREQGRLFWM